MDLLYSFLVVLHLLGMAMLVGGWLLHLRAPKIVIGMWHGALTQLVTGLALVGLASAGAVDHEVVEAKVGVKLVIALVVAVLIHLERRKRRQNPSVVHVVGLLAVVNVLIAVLWH